MNKFLLLAIILVFSAFLFIDESDWLESKRMARMGAFPELNYKPSISRGKAEYQKTCIECHGTGLLGSEKGPSLLDSTYKDSHHADLSFYYAVKSGVRQHHWQFGDMPKIAGLPPERVSDIIAYVRHKQKLSNIK